jgi:hypothetical protein
MVGMMSWYLRSMGDHQTHRGQYSITTRNVHSACGVEFVPMKLSTGAPIVLVSPRPDPAQVCRDCRGDGGER